jgi:hypothetical protein
MSARILRFAELPLLHVSTSPRLKRPSRATSAKHHATAPSGRQDSPNRHHLFSPNQPDLTPALANEGLGSGAGYLRGAKAESETRDHGTPVGLPET